MSMLQPARDAVRRCCNNFLSALITFSSFFILTKDVYTMWQMFLIWFFLLDEKRHMHVEWRTWINSFHIYSQAIELEKKSDSIQTATMLHCLGLLVQRIYETLPDKKDTLKEAEKALEQYFAPKRNVVAERYKFRSRKQNSDEPIDAYLSRLRDSQKRVSLANLKTR